MTVWNVFDGKNDKWKSIKLVNIYIYLCVCTNNDNFTESNKTRHLTP